MEWKWSEIGVKSFGGSMSLVGHHKNDIPYGTTGTGPRGRMFLVSGCSKTYK